MLWNTGGGEFSPHEKENEQSQIAAPTKGGHAADAKLGYGHIKPIEYHCYGSLHQQVQMLSFLYILYNRGKKEKRKKNNLNHILKEEWGIQYESV